MSTTLRNSRLARMASTVAADLRFALRQFGRAPAFTAAAVLTIALGIGINVAMFGLVDGILLRPLPYTAAHELVRLYQSSDELGVTHGKVSADDFEDWQVRTRSFSAAATYLDVTVPLIGHGEPIEIEAAVVSAGFFDVFGVPMALGRPLGAMDFQTAARVAVISHDLWVRGFGADSAVIGAPLGIVFGADAPFTIVGVAARGFRFPAQHTEAWIPDAILTPDMVGPRQRDARIFDGVARLAPGMAHSQAQAELDAVAQQIAREHPSTNRDWDRAQVVSLKEVVVGDVDRALVIVLGLVVLVLLIACANLANLILARDAVRAREVAIRSALGAGRPRLLRQHMTESLLLGVLGGGLGVALAAGLLHGVVVLAGDTLPRTETLALDVRMAVFGFVLSLVTGVLFGWLPAWRLASVSPRTTMHGARSTVGAGGGHVRRTLVVAEVTLAVILVIAAGLMARSFLELRNVDPGFDARSALAAVLQINMAGVDEDQIDGHILRTRLAWIEHSLALPGVVAAATTNSLPLQSDGEPFDLTRRDAPDSRPLRAHRSYVSSGYFQALGIAMLHGESFSDQPITEWPVPIVISNSVASRVWPGASPIGEAVMTAWGGPFVVTGVVADVHQSGLARDPSLQVYLPQSVGPRITTALVVRTNDDPNALVTPLREMIRGLDPNQPIRQVAPMTQVIADSVARDRFFTLLFAGFGGLALALAAIGIYGVLAYSVGQRTAEIGLRMALGAQSRDVLRLVVREGLILVATGIAIGTGLGLLLARLLGALLHGITATDPPTIAASVVLLATVALVASYLPARRAAGIEPTDALRRE